MGLSSLGQIKAHTCWYVGIASNINAGLCQHAFQIQQLQTLHPGIPQCKSLQLQASRVKPTIHHTLGNFVAGDTATLLFVRAAHEISNATFYKLLENRQPIYMYFQATGRMYHAIFPCAAHTNNNVAVSPATKVASCMVGLTIATATVQPGTSLCTQGL